MSESNLFEPWPKMARLSREVVVTEKLDGTNAQVFVSDNWSDGAVAVVDGYSIFAGSRTRIVTPDSDNFGFADWVQNNADELVKLGPGRHFGEWWGRGIQRQYGKRDRTFSLFNTSRWSDAATRPKCCSVVPVLYRGMFDTVAIEAQIVSLRQQGSVAAPGFMEPEGIIVWHTAANIGFKKTCKNDDKHKGEQ